jgi:hypothetical protein
LTSRTAKRAPLEEAEAQQGGDEPRADDDVNHLARGSGAGREGFDRVQHDPGGHGRGEAPYQRAVAVGASDLVVHQLAHLARAAPEAAGKEPGEDDRDQQQPASVAHHVDRSHPVARGEEGRLLDDDEQREDRQHPRTATIEPLGELGVGMGLHDLTPL